MRPIAGRNLASGSTEPKRSSARAVKVAPTKPRTVTHGAEAPTSFAINTRARFIIESDGIVSLPFVAAALLRTVVDYLMLKSMFWSVPRRFT